MKEFIDDEDGYMKWLNWQINPLGKRNSKMHLKFRSNTPQIRRYTLEIPMLSQKG